MNYFWDTIAAVATIFSYATYRLFKKGGPYNPEMPSTDSSTMPVYSPPTASTSPKVESVTESTPYTPKRTLETFCHAIEAMEGGPGDASHRNCNPGNFRCSPVGYLPKYGKVGCSAGGFAIFPTYQLGWEYLIASVHYRAAQHPHWTIIDFFENYSPKGDGNDPVTYANFVAKACGTVPNITLAKLFA